MPRFQLAPIRNGRADWNSATPVDVVALTVRQRQVLDCISDHLHARGYAPTQQQIANAIGLASAGSVNHHVGNLEALGVLGRRARGTRAVAPASNTATIVRRLRIIHGDAL